jgi:hypothetical protein
MKINYIIAMYFGPRRSYGAGQDKFIFLKEQIRFLSELPKDSDIIHAVFSINEIEEVSREEIERIVKASNIRIPYEIRYRPNVGYSYANWNEVLIEYRNKDFDYHFLIEDDYIPTNPYFYNIFVELMAEKIPFVCMLASEHGFMGHQRHPTICIGLIRSKEAYEVLENKGSVLCIYPGQTYTFAEQSQIHMMDYFNEMGHGFVGLPDNIRKPFWDNSIGLWERGGFDPPVIIPIGIDISEKGVTYP